MIRPDIPEAPPIPQVRFSSSTRRDQGSPQYCEWDLKELTLYTQDWFREAEKEGVDISEQKRKIVQVILDAPGPDPRTNKLHEVTLVQQIVVRGMYCSQIIREITLQKIRRIAEAGRQTKELSHKIGLINQCENWALKQLPGKIFLRSPKIMAQQCYWLLGRVDEMRMKIT